MNIIGCCLYFHGIVTHISLLFYKMSFDGESMGLNDFGDLLEKGFS